MFQINEQRSGLDLALMLDGDQGTYLVQQGGQNFIAVSASGHSLKSLRPVGQSTVGGSEPDRWLVTKISEQDISSEYQASGQQTRAAGR